MATPAPLVSETTLTLIVKQLQYFAQEIGTLKQHREQLHGIYALKQLNEDQQQEIDALKTRLPCTSMIMRCG